MRIDLIMACLIAATGAGLAQSSGGAPPRQQAAPAGLDLNAARRGAAELAAVRAILNDPDADVRLMAVREIALNGTPAQRHVAIEVGLASLDPLMRDTAVRMLVSGLTTVTLPFVDENGAPQRVGGEGLTALTMTITSFDLNTGTFSGLPVSGCQLSGNEPLSGQVSGAVVNFRTQGDKCNGSLRWNSEAGAFVGTVNLDYGRAGAERRVVWKPN